MSRLDRFNQALTKLGANPDFFWKYVREFDEDHDLYTMEKLERGERSFEDTVSKGFLWYRTPEGYHFWLRISERIREYDEAYHE